MLAGDRRPRRPGVFGRGTPARAGLSGRRRAVLAGRDRCPRPPVTLFVVSVPAGDPHFAAVESAALLTGRPVAASWFLVLDRRVDYTMASETHTSTAPGPAGCRRPRACSPRTSAGLARQSRDVAVPGHRGDVLHRVDRVLHRAAGRQLAHCLHQPLFARPTHWPGSKTRMASCSTQPAKATRRSSTSSHSEAGLSKEDAEKLVEEAHHSKALISGLKPEKAASLLAELKSAGAEVEDRGVGDAQVADALRRVDQSAGDQSDRGQYVHSDLLVADDGAGLVRHSGREKGQGLVLPSGHRLDRIVFLVRSGLRVLSVDGRATISRRASAPRAISGRPSVYLRRVSSR